MTMQDMHSYIRPEFAEGVRQCVTHDGVSPFGRDLSRCAILTGIYVVDIAWARPRPNSSQITSRTWTCAPMPFEAALQDHARPASSEIEACSEINEKAWRRFPITAQE